jgi:hypothetical protein
MNSAIKFLTFFAITICIFVAYMSFNQNGEIDEFVRRRIIQSAPRIPSGQDICRVGKVC